MVALVHGVGLLALGVGAGAGLGQAESADPLAAAQLGQILGLLLRGAVLVDGGGAQRVWAEMITPVVPQTLLISSTAMT